MQLKAGSRLQSTACDTQVIVVRAPKDEVDLRCGGHLLAAAAPAEKAALDPKHSGGSAMGKRYADEGLGLELLITKVHAAGGLVHIWAWGDEARRWTPVRWGKNGKVDKRLQRYIAARLGPLRERYARRTSLLERLERAGLTA